MAVKRPTIDINCPQPTIYVNLRLESSDKNTDGKNPGSQSDPVPFELKEGGSIQIFCDQEKEPGLFTPSASDTDKLIGIIEFRKPSSKGTSSKVKPMPVYVITVHKNNVPGEESRTTVESKRKQVDDDSGSPKTFVRKREG